MPASAVLNDSNAEILCVVNNFKGVTRDHEFCLYLEMFVGNDVDDLTFFWWELHLPLCLLC